MVSKTNISKESILQVLNDYSIGTYFNHEPISAGNTQTNVLLQTNQGKYIFRYYENRTKESVSFECNLINYLKEQNYPCPTVIGNTKNTFVGLLNNKPYAVFEFMEGKHIENPSKEQKYELIKYVALLQNITRNYKPHNLEHRWNYNPELCLKLARKEAEILNTKDSSQKLKWLEKEVERLELPESLPRGICHCDFHFSNVLFKNGKFNALIDFDDANCTYLTFDLAALLEPFISDFNWDTWKNFKTKDSVLDFTEARFVAKEYEKYRTLTNEEKLYLFDVFKLAVLFDTFWYFKRGDASDFYEKRKVDALNSLGRQGFHDKIFNLNP